jgi:hypothetical protein
VDEVFVSGPMLKRKPRHNDYRGTSGQRNKWLVFEMEMLVLDNIKKRHMTERTVLFL